MGFERMKGRRVPVTPVIVGSFCALAAALAMFGWTKTWTVLGIPTLSPPFADVRTITGAWQSFAAGHDPLVSNPGDPWGRPLDYPRFWADAAIALKLTQRSAVGIGALFALFYIGATVWLLRATRTDASWTGYLMAFSSASLLGLERGNSDLLVFAVVVAAGLMMRRHGRAAGLTLGAAGLLKIFPVLAVPFLFSRDRGRNLGLAAALALVAAYLFWHFGDLVLIARGKPVGTGLSYGVPALHSALVKFAHGAGMLGRMPVLAWQAVSVAVVGACVALGFRFDVLRRTDIHDVMLFMLGASIYVTTFVLASNFDYRLIFLILCLPLLLHAEVRGRRFLAALILVAMNQIWLWDGFGMAGAAFNLAAKCVLFLALGAALGGGLRRLWVSPGAAS